MPTPRRPDCQRLRTAALMSLHPDPSGTGGKAFEGGGQGHLAAPAEAGPLRIESPSAASTHSGVLSPNASSRGDGTGSWSPPSCTSRSRSKVRASSLGAVARNAEGQLLRREASNPAMPRRDEMQRSASKKAADQLEAEKLKYALGKAKRAGIDDKLVRHAQKLMHEEHESRELLRASGTGDQKVFRSTFNRQVTQAGVEKTVKEKSKKTLTTCEVFMHLEQAIASKDLKALQTAILEAKRIELPKEDIEAAERVGKTLEARSRLRAALDLKHIDAVKWALENTQLACEDPKLVREVKQHLKRLETLKDLELAASIKDGSALKQCLAEAQELGVDGPEVSRAAHFLAHLESREASRPGTPGGSSVGDASPLIARRAKRRVLTCPNLRLSVSQTLSRSASKAKPPLA
mmetsp:Transcript_87854/g.273057  ORF Transcript_87854/g.273057 Transcript_87854/m.273057 type:complete len:406 (+) Transcript_87854:44-1261(+)